jgi:hypothetical protein
MSGFQLSGTTAKIVGGVVIGLALVAAVVGYLIR